MPDRPIDHVVVTLPVANDEGIGPNDVTVSFATAATVHIPAGAVIPATWREIVEGGTLTLDAGDGPAAYEVLEVTDGDDGR